MNRHWNPRLLLAHCSVCEFQILRVGLRLDKINSVRNSYNIFEMADNKMIRNEEASGSGSGSNHSNGRCESLVVDVGIQRSSCCYCKSGSHTSITHGLRVLSLTVDDYQALLDRGWRRLGCYLFKPEMEKTCCPSYTIRLMASEFVPSKEQVRVAKRMQKFINGTLNFIKPDKHVQTSACKSSVQRNIMVDNGVQNNDLDHVKNYLSSQIDSIVHMCIQRGDFPPDIQFLKASVKSVAPAKRKLQAEESQSLLYSSNISFQIAAALKRANKNTCFLKSSHPNPKSVAEELTSHLSKLSPSFGLCVKACNGHINFYSAETQPETQVLVKKSTVSKDSGDKSCSLDFKCQVQAKGSNLVIRTKRSSFDPEEYELYKKYQIRVHNDAPEHVTEDYYKQFLVDSPLVYVPSSGDSVVPPCGFGSFHQQYLINGKLVAVGVMDILPTCLSSTYLFWDPDFAFLSLGKYTALQEINWVRENEGRCPNIRYYYLGYYVHSCNKMRYKADYRPSDLLCPLRYKWVPFDIAKRLLDKKPYVVLSDFATLQNEEYSSLNVFEEHIEQHEEAYLQESNDIPFEDYEYDDEEMSELDFEDSDDESEPETASLSPMQKRNEALSNIVISLKGMRLRYKDIQETFGPKERSYLETQLHRYLRAVGAGLSERMVYSLD